MPRQNSTGITSTSTTTTGSKSAWAVENVVAPGTANTQFTISIGSSVKEFQIRVRGAGKLQISDTTGQTSSKYWTVMPGNCYREEQLNLSSGITLYCELNKASETIEVIKWT